MSAPQLQIPDHEYNLLQSAIDYAVMELNDRIYEREEDYSDADRDTMNDKVREFRELSDWLKIQTGKAFDWDAHWTAVITDKGDNYLIPYGEVSSVDEHHVWTIMDDGEGGLCISPGVRYVNRLDYIMTTEPWTEADEQKEWIY